MKEKMETRVRGIAWLCTVVYFTSYLLRSNFGVMLVKICSDLSREKTDLAIVVTALTICYGAGQLVSGYLGDRVSPRIMLTCGILISAVCNLSMQFCTSILPMAVIWGINGFANSMLWAPIIRLFTMYLNDKQYAYAMLRVMLGSTLSTVVLYTLCPGLLLVLNWRRVMMVIGFIGIAVGTTFFLLSPRYFKKGSGQETMGSTDTSNGKPEKKPLPAMVWLPFVLIILGIIAQGILRDGVNTWTPSFLYDTFNMKEENAIFSTVVLAILAFASFYLFDWINRKWLKNEVTCAAFIFAISAVATGVLYLLQGRVSAVVLSLLMLAVVEGCMHGANMMLIANVPKRFAKSGRVSFLSGLLDAFSYVGASISTYGCAVLATNFGWKFTIFMWFAVSVFGIAICLLASRSWRNFAVSYAEAKDI